MNVYLIHHTSIIRLAGLALFALWLVQPQVRAHELIPPASKPCTEEERKWWERLRKAARDAAEASDRKQQAFT